MEYVIVIPAKNEASGISETLDAIINQSWKPKMCMVVDDGSTDETAHIILNYQKKYSFIRYLENNAAKNQSYSLGGNVVNVFNIGKLEIDKLTIKYDFIVKLDADIQFESDFVENLFKRIENVSDYGIVSGTPFYWQNNKKVYEYSPLWHTHGQFKFYNKECLEEIGGLKKSLGWDTADNIVAMTKGWRTKAFRDITYKMKRKVGGKSSLKKGRINHGIGTYILGYNILYLGLKILHDFFKPPYLLGSTYLFYGYLKALKEKRKRILAPDEIRLLRKLLWQSLFSRLKNKDFIVFQQLNTKT